MGLQEVNAGWQRYDMYQPACVSSFNLCAVMVAVRFNTRLRSLQNWQMSSPEDNWRWSQQHRSIEGACLYCMPVDMMCLWIVHPACVCVFPLVWFIVTCSVMEQKFNQLEEMSAEVNRNLYKREATALHYKRLE